jgi:hypothetical protein
VVAILAELAELPVFPSFLIKMHEKKYFPLKITEKEGKPDLRLRVEAQWEPAVQVI